jgi:hypothetical protein
MQPILLIAMLLIKATWSPRVVYLCRGRSLSSWQFAQMASDFPHLILTSTNNTDYLTLEKKEEAANQRIVVVPAFEQTI